jgi:acyl-CoA synthetase (AMP-forming)/AMP-acid ligase II
VGFNLADLLESVAAAIGDREAVVCAARGEEPALRLTYRQLDERADRLAHVLAGMGVGRDDAVGLVMRNGNEYLEATLACFKLRAVPVNVNHRAVPHEVAAVLAHSRAVAVLHDAELAPLVAATGHAAPTLARGADWEAALAAAPDHPVRVERSGDDRYLLYTGGTTGRPKGVVWRHEDLYFSALNGSIRATDPVSDPAQVVAAARNGRRRCLTASPFMHGTGHWMALTTLLEGGTVVVVRDTRLDADGLLEVAAREAVTMLVIVGDAFGRPLVDALAAREDRDDLSTLNVIVSGGAALSPSTTADLLRLLPWTMVVDGFGASETGGQGQRVSYPGAPPTSSGDRRFLMRPDTTVVDDELRPLEPGDGRTGWLARRGRVPLGYLDDPEGTARTFPVVGGVRWALPGDRASIEADGTISVHGRGSSTISTGGETVHAEEVESVVRAHPDVLDAVVVGVPDPRWEEVVTAVASVRPGRDLTVQSLDAHCRPALASYKLPRRLVVVPEVVRTASGKADLRWAREAATG